MDHRCIQSNARDGWAVNRGVPTRYMFGTCIGWPAALTTARKLRPQAKQWNAAGTLRAHPGDHFGGLAIAIPRDLGHPFAPPNYLPSGGSLMLCPQLSLRACMPYLAIPLLVGCSGRGAGSAQSARAMPDEQRSAYIASVQAEARTDAAHRVHPVSGCAKRQAEAGRAAGSSRSARDLCGQQPGLSRRALTAQLQLWRARSAGDASAQQAELTSSDELTGDMLGASVAISGDTAIVGSSLSDRIRLGIPAEADREARS